MTLHDPNAMVIRMPKINDIPQEFHENVTKEAHGKNEEQRVKDIANLIVGRVPR